MADRRARACVVAAGLTLVAAACSGAGDEVAVEGTPPTSGAPAAPTTAPPTTAPSSTAPPTTAPPTTAPPTTAPPTTAPDLPDALIVAGSSGPAYPVVGDGDEFLRFEPVDGAIALAASADGIAWEQRETQPALAGDVAAVATDGVRIVALLSDPADDTTVPAPWVTDDGGRTWSEIPLPEVLPAAPEFVESSFDVGGVAVDGERIVLTGLVQRRVEWQRYAIEVLRQDHGHATGEGGDPEAWTVRFQDGFELTVNLVDLGFADIAFGAAVPISVFVHDGSRWIESAGFTLDGTEIIAPQVVVGPAGFAANAGTRFVTSQDGIVWVEHPAPPSAAEYGARVIGNAAAYVLVTPESLFRSTDGATWSDEHVVTTVDPWTTGFGFMRPRSYAAGPAGFVVGLPVFGSEGIESVSVAWSADGATWEEHDLPQGTIDMSAAVADVAALVIPAGEQPVDLPELPADEAGLHQALVSTFFHPDGVFVGEGFELRLWMTEEEAACTADRLLDLVGADRVREIRFGLFPFHLLGYGLSDLIELEDAHAIAASMRGCSPDWELFMITTATSGAEQISEPSARCIAEALDDDVSEEMVAIELARPYDDVDHDGTADLSHLQPLWDALDECLTDQELNALDWS